VHGWIDVRVTLDRVAVDASVSDVPSDSLAGLVSALIHVASGVAQASVVWHLEPEEWEWTFQSSRDRAGADLVTFRAACPLFPTVEAGLPRGKLLHAMILALTRLRAENAWETDEHAWSWPFPEALLERLRRMASV